jgi:hypothetical protein
MAFRFDSRTFGAGLDARENVPMQEIAWRAFKVRRTAVADEQKPDKAMAGMLKRKSVWPPASTEEVCPDAAALAAYFDHSLSVAETSHCELHFSTCLRCQEQLAALARSEPASAPKPVVERQPAISWLWDWRWMAPVGAAVVVLVFFVSYRTMFAPAGPSGGGEMVAKREAATPAPAASEKQKSIAPMREKSNAAADAVMETKSSSGKLQEKSRSELTAKDAVVRMDELQRKNAAADLESARAAQAPKDKGARTAEGAAGAVAPRVLPKPAEEDKRVAMAENRVIAVQPAAPGVSGAVPSGALAGPAQGGALRVLGVQKQDRATAVADTKEPVAQAPAEVQGKEQAALKQESAADRQDAAPGRYALQTAPQSASKHRAAPSEFIVTTPNSKVLWRLASDGRIERSRDAGKTWETQKSPAQESFLSGSAPSESICWVGGSNGVLLRTTDGGENWERISSPTKSDIIVVKATDQLAVNVIGADGRSYETRDAGAHWRAR